VSRLREGKIKQSKYSLYAVAVQLADARRIIARISSPKRYISNMIHTIVSCLVRDLKINFMLIEKIFYYTFIMHTSLSLSLSLSLRLIMLKYVYMLLNYDAT